MKSLIQLVILCILVIAFGVVPALASDTAAAAAVVTDTSLLGILTTNSAIILGAFLAVSEALAIIPAIKSNSIFQLIVNILKTLTGNKDYK